LKEKDGFIEGQILKVLKVLINLDRRKHTAKLSAQLRKNLQILG
jgi:hypothetical protein